MPTLLRVINDIIIYRSAPGCRGSQPWGGATDSQLGMLTYGGGLLYAFSARILGTASTAPLSSHKAVRTSSA